MITITDYSVRYHIPLTTNEGCGFHVIDRQGVKHEQTMAPGECWFLNQGLKHSAWNKGKTPRAAYYYISFNTRFRCLIILKQI